MTKKVVVGRLLAILAGFFILLGGPSRSSMHPQRQQDSVGFRPTECYDARRDSVTDSSSIATLMFWPV